MRTISYAFFILVLLSGQAAAADKATELKTENEKLSYALGLDLGAYFKSLGEDFDLTVIQKGISDYYNGKDALMTKDEAAKVQQQFAARQQEKQVKKVMEKSTGNKKKATVFLAENKDKDGVKVTDSGLQYKVVKEGKGAKPAANSKVKVHYMGTLLNGTEFDSSYKRKQPAEFRVDQVIPGWTEALQLMTVGSTYELYIPSELAYGDRGAPPVIEPGSMLIFNVELLEIVKSEEKKEGKKEDKKEKKK